MYNFDAMRAAVLEAFHQPLTIRDDYPDPTCGPDDVVLRVEANGVCRSDHHIWTGGFAGVGIVPELPLVLGHEYCGVIEEVGARVRRFKKGDRVVAPFGHSCGTCECCSLGQQNVCSDIHIPGMHFTGGYAAYAKVSRADVNCVRLPDAISSRDAASLGCRFNTAYHGLVGQAKVAPGEWVVVLACGGVGLAAVDIASALGASVIAVSRNPAKLALARELGAVHTLTWSDAVVDAIVELTGGGAHVTVDALGDAALCVAGLKSLRAKGRHVRLGLGDQRDRGVAQVPVDMMVMRELTLVGSFGMEAPHFPAMLRMVETGKLHPARLVSRTISLAEASGVLAAMDNYETTGMVVIDRF